MPTILRHVGLLTALLLSSCGGAPILESTVLHSTEIPQHTGSAAAGLRAAATMLAEVTEESRGRSVRELHQLAAATTETEDVHPELLDDCDRARSIVVRKGARLLELRCGGELAARHPISLGFAPEGHKHHEGDGRTPEGAYYITSKFISQYHRSLQLSYPNVSDAERGLGEGQISSQQHAAIVRANQACRLPPQNTALGSLLQIHGSGGGADYGDWTLGCVALENDAIEQAYAFQLPGCNADGQPRTPVLILP